MKYPTLHAYPNKARRFGMHWNASSYPNQAAIKQEIPRLTRMGVCWVKLVCDGDAGLGAAYELAQAGIEPVIRLYRPEPHPWYVPDSALVRAYGGVGAHYFEAGNEPNLIGRGGEWNGRFDFEALMRQWQRQRESILNGGGIPMLFALSPGGNAPVGDHARMYRLMFEWLDRYNDRLEDCALASHPRPLNHPMDYPFDAINQREHPGATLDTDSTCFLVVNWLDAQVRTLTGGRSIPILGTEFGCSVGDAQDNRYPTITRELHAARNVNQMMDADRTGYIHTDTERTTIRLTDALFAMCHWIYGQFGHIAFSADSWVDNPLFGGILPAVGEAERYAAAHRYARYWHGTTPDPVQPPPVPPPQPLGSFEVHPIPLPVIRVQGDVPGVQVQLGSNVLSNPAAKHEPDFRGVEFGGLGHGLWTVRAQGYATANVEVGANKGALLVPRATPQPRPQPDPEPEPTPQPEPEPQLDYGGFALGFAAYAAAHPALALRPRGQLIYHPDSGDAIQPVWIGSGTGASRTQGMLVWYRTTGTVRLHTEEVGHGG